MNLMLVEPEASGHRMVLYVRHVIREALSRNWTVSLLTTRRATQHPAFDSVAREHGARIRLHFANHVDFPVSRPTRRALLQHQYRQFRALSSAFARVAATDPPDLIYMNTLDYCDKVMPILGSPFAGSPFAGMLMAPAFHRNRAGIIAPPASYHRVYEWAFQRLLRTPGLRAITVIDPSFMRYTATLAATRRSMVHYVPDAGVRGDVGSAAGRAEARSMLALNDSSVAVLLYGSITMRKGIAQLVAALSDPRTPANVVGIIAGSQDEAARRVLGGRLATELRGAGRLIELDEFLDDVSEQRVFSAADIAWLNYDGFFGMSGVLLQAGAHGLPVLASREGLIGWLVREHALGLCVPANDANSAVTVLKQLAGDPAMRERLGENGARMAAHHTPQIFASAVCDVLGGEL